MSYERDKDMIKYMIKEEMEKCIGPECARIENEVIPKKLDEWHENYSNSQHDPEDIFCAYCSFTEGRKEVRYGTQGCNHGPQ